MSIINLLKKVPLLKTLFARNTTTMAERLKEGGALLKDTSLHTVPGMINHLKQGKSLLEYTDKEISRHWLPRIKIVQESLDNGKIEYVPGAGTFNDDGNLVMHNGLLISPLSYYNFPMLELLFKNKGVHEPQEEYAFQEVLKHIPEGAIMLELGAYWSFYSMWFNAEVKRAKNYLIEPENIDAGITNFKLNEMEGDFTQAYISDNSKEIINGVPTVCIDDFVQEKNIEFVDILHSDIQGHEFKMLMGAEELLGKMNVGYVFVSTHSNKIHAQCLAHLTSKGYDLVCAYDLDESYAFDGLIVCKNPSYPGLDAVDVSKRSK